MNTILKSVVGSRLKGFNVSNNSDLDIRGIFACDVKDHLHPWKSVKDKEWRYNEKVLYQGKNYLSDLDAWEITKFAKACRNGDPLMISLLFSNQIVESSESGNIALDNRIKFVSSDLVRGTLKFCKRKVKRAQGVVKNPKTITTIDGQYRSPEKYLVYALAPLVEIKDLLLNGGIEYPLRYNLDEMIALRKGEMNFDKGLELYKELEKEIYTIKNPYQFDRDFVSNWVIDSYISTNNSIC